MGQMIVTNLVLAAMRSCLDIVLRKEQGQCLYIFPEYKDLPMSFNVYDISTQNQICEQYPGGNVGLENDIQTTLVCPQINASFELVAVNCL